MRRSGIYPLVAALLLAAAGCRTSPAPRPLEPELAIEHYVRGQLALAGGDVERALAELARAVEADPTLAVAYASLGDVHLRQGNKELAAENYELAIERNSFAFRPHYNLGVTYQMLADEAQTQGLVQRTTDYLRRAVGVYLQAEKLRESDFDTQLNVAACYYHLGDLDAAEMHARRAIQIDATSTRARGNLALIHESRDDLDRAIRTYLEALEIDSRQGELLMRLGEAYLRQGPESHHRALRAFQQAADLAPDDAQPWERQGLIYYRQGEYDASLAAFQKAVDLDPRSPTAHRGLGTAYIVQWVLDQQRADLRLRGLDAWQTSLELRPDQPQLRHLVDKYTTMEPADQAG